MCLNVIFSEPYKWMGNINAPWFRENTVYCKVCNKKINRGNLVCNNTSSQSYLQGLSHSRCARKIEKEINEERELQILEKLQEAYEERKEPIPRGDLPSIDAIAQATGIKLNRIRNYLSGQLTDELSSIIRDYVDKLGYEKIEIIDTIKKRIVLRYYWPGRFLCKVNWDGSIEKKKSSYFLFDNVEKLPNDDRYICYDNWFNHPINHKASYILGKTVHSDAFIISKNDLELLKNQEPLRAITIDNIIVPQKVEENNTVSNALISNRTSERIIKIKRKPLEGKKINRALYYSNKKKHL